MVTDELVERIKNIGVFPKSIRDCAEIFEKCETLGDIEQEVRRREWACSEGQFVYFHLGALLEYDPQFKARFFAEAEQQLGNLGIKPGQITEYYRSGADPGLVFVLKHEREYTKEVRITFYQKADQFAFNELKRWLGIPTTSKQ